MKKFFMSIRVFFLTPYKDILLQEIKYGNTATL